MIKAVWILLGIIAVLLGMALIYILFLLVCDLLVDPKGSGKGTLGSALFTGEQSLLQL